MLRYFKLLWVVAVFIFQNDRSGIRSTEAAEETEELVVDRDDWFYSVQECASSSLRCWTAPTTYRFSSVTDKEADPSSATRSGLSLYAAANEFEAFQVALKSDSGGDVTCTASLSDFSPSLGSPNERRVEIHTVGYDNDKNLADSLNRLPNEASTFTVKSSVNAAATSLWVRVYVPIDAAKGVYTAQLKVKKSSDDSTLATIPVTLTVFGFALPVSSTFKTQINLSVGDMKPSFLDTELERVDWAKQFLLEYRMTPKSVAWPSGLSPSIAWDNDNSNGPGQCSVLNDEDYESLPYSAGKNTKRYALGQDWPLRRWPVDANDTPLCSGATCPVSLRSNTGFSTDMLFQFPDNSEPRPNSFCGNSIGGDNFGTTAYNNEWSQFIDKLDEYVRLPENGNLESEAYIYVQNEPQDDDDLRLANHLCRIYKNAAPGMKIAISEEAKPEIAERAEGDCGYDIWIAHVPAFDKDYAWDRLSDHGEESWFYSLPQDGGAYFSPCEGDVGVNDGMNVRVISWTAFAARIRGWAYYKMEIFFEGTAPMRPKIGAEIFRDSMEDYEYLYLANGQTQPMPGVSETADPVANAVGFSFTAWLRDHAEFAAIRRELGFYVDGTRTKLAVPPRDSEPTAEPIYVNFQDPDSPSTPGDLIVANNTYLKVGWEAFDLAKGYGWSGDGFGSDGKPLARLIYGSRTGGANALENLYIYNNYGRENKFDMAAANGWWRVTVAVGYPGDDRADPQDVVVNGVVLNDRKTTGVEYFTKDVEVKTGYLTVAFGETFDKYCFASHFQAIPVDIPLNPSDDDDSDDPDDPDGEDKLCGLIWKRSRFCILRWLRDMWRQVFGKN